VFAIGSVFGGTVAFTIGAIAGLLYGVVEVLLLGACGRLYRWATSNPT
jgi:low affinity Fe/Cu permease